MMFSKQFVVLALSLSLGHAMVHTALSPRSHNLQASTRLATHNEAVEELDAREEEIIDANERRVQVANRWLVTEQARIAALRADLVAEHGRAVAAIAPTRTELHGRMTNSGLFVALPSTDPAVAVAPAAPAALTGRPAALQERQNAAIRLENERHAAQLAELDRSLVDLNGEHATLLEGYAHELRAALEETRARHEALVHEQRACNNNLAERLLRWQAEMQRVAGDAAAADHTAEVARIAAARLARRDAAIRGAGGR